MDISKFVLRSIGIAAENKALDSVALEVFPTEMLPFTDGEITSFKDNHTHKGVDGAGKPYTAQVQTANSVKAYWLSMGSNRMTPPDIRRGERVLIYQYADDDKYYWKESGLDDNLRRLETVVYAFSATKDETVRALTPDNSYMVSVSTHQKHITLSTSKANGEPYTYTFQFDLNKGNVVLSDNIGNFIQLTTANNSITLKNANGSLLSVIGNDIFGQCADNFNITCQTFNLDCDTMNTAATTAINTQTKTMTETLTTMNTTASSGINTTTPMFLQTGNLGVTALATLNAIAGGAAPGAGGTPPMSINASSTMINVPTTIISPVTTTGVLMNNGIAVGATHQHISNVPGVLTGPVVN